VCERDDIHSDNIYEVIYINIGSSAAPRSRVDPCVCGREIHSVEMTFMRSYVCIHKHLVICGASHPRGSLCVLKREIIYIEIIFMK